MWIESEDGSVVDEAGNVIFFSTRRFVEDICLGECCFICGAGPGTKPFNDEHVLPNWLLRDYELHHRFITLPNGQQFRYDRFTIPCCTECNTLLGQEIESPMSEVVRAGYDTFAHFVANGGLLRVFVWLGLIFLKTHLKDRSFRWHVDARQGHERISEFHTWEELHHLHCLVRSFCNEAHVDQDAAGSFLMLPTRREISPDNFDFLDLSEGQTIMLRLGSFALFAVFNDSGGAMNWFHQRLELINGPISELQAREIAADLAYLNMHLDPRPTFHTEIDRLQETSHIRAVRPPAPEMSLFDPEIRGALLNRAIGYAIENIRPPGTTQQQVIQSINVGTFTCLLNEAGEFNSGEDNSA